MTNERLEPGFYASVYTDMSHSLGRHDTLALAKEACQTHWREAGQTTRLEWGRFGEHWTCRAPDSDTRYGIAVIKPEPPEPTPAEYPPGYTQR